MTAMRKITVEVPDDLGRHIDREAARQGYRNESDFVLACLTKHLGADQPEIHDPEIEQWLRDEVVPTYDRWKRQNTPGLTSAEVFDDLEARYLARKRVG